MNIYKLIPLIIISTVFSQFYDVEVEIDFQRMKKNQLYILENLEYEIENYFLSNKFSPEYDYIDIPIKIQFIIESVIDNSNEIIITSRVLLSNYSDQYFFSSLVFPYYRGKSLAFNPISNESLTAFLNYYANLFIGYELDTYNLYMGSTYFIKSLDISDEMKFSNFPQDWEKRKDDVRDIQANIKLRNIRYNYFYIYDLNNNDTPHSENIIYSKLIEIYNDLEFIYEKIGYDKNTLKFLDAYSLAIYDLICFELSGEEQLDAINFLTLFDEVNKGIYSKNCK